MHWRRSIAASCMRCCIDFPLKCDAVLVCRPDKTRQRRIRHPRIAAGCGVNALSGLPNRANSIHCRCHVGLIRRIRLLRGYFCEIKIKVILLFGIIRIKLRYCIEYEPFNGITVFQVNNRQLKPVRPRKKRRGSLFRKIVKSLPRSLSVKKIEVAGEIGRRDDAFLSVLICGIVSVFMDALFRFILNVLIKVKRSENCVINIFPAPNRSTFNLNMAGIVRVNLIKLFLNVFIRKDKAE